MNLTQVTNTLTCGALLATGDFLQQKIEKVKGQNQGLDSSRLGEVQICNIKKTSRNLVGPDNF